MTSIQQRPDGATATLWPAHSVASTGEDRITHRDKASRLWLFSAIFWLTFVDLVGLVMATELVSPNLFGGVPFLVFSRIRQIHVNGVIFAWLSMMYWGAIFYMLPRMNGTRLWSDRLGVATAWGWNLMFAAGAVTLSLGFQQGREYAEFIWPVDVLLVTLWLANVVNVVMTVFQRRVKALYVATWWMLASPMWLAANYIIGNVMWKPGNLLGNGISSIPGQAVQVSGALDNQLHDAMLNWWQNHNLFGLWLTPMLVAISYYLVPRITNTPLYSHTLSLISFWGLAFFYTGVGHHHLLQAPIPAWARTFATVNSILLLIPVFAFVTNIVLTMRGNWQRVFTNMPLRFLITGFIFYFLVNLQGTAMALPGFNRTIHFTNFIVAHAHLALLGAFTILGMGTIDYIITQIYKRPPYSRRLLEWQYWLVLIGFTGFFLSLTFASFLQGQAWAISIPEVNVLPMIQPHYVARGAFGAMIVTSGIIQAVNMWMTVRTDTSAKHRRQLSPYIESGHEADTKMQERVVRGGPGEP